MPLSFGGKSETLTILLKGKDKFSKVFSKAETKLGGLKGTLKKVGIGAAVAGAAIAAMAVGLGVKAVNAAMKFETAMGNVATLINTSTESMGAMKKEVLALAKDAPVKIEDLTAALYQVRSAGISAGDAMGLLESSMKLGVAGLGTTEEATNLLTSAFNVFEKQGLSSAKMADILFKTVKAGKTTVAELAMSFGMVAPIAGEMNIKLEELSAATAALTTTGMKASVAQSQLRMVLVSMMKPTGDMSDLFEKIGVKTGRELIETSDGMVGALNAIRVAAEGDEEALAKALGSVEALNAAYFLTSEAGGRAFLETQEDMLSATSELEIAYRKQKEIFDKTWAAISLKLNVALTKLGLELLPSVGEAINTIVIPQLERISDWVEVHGEDISRVFANIIDLIKPGGFERLTERITARLFPGGGGITGALGRGLERFTRGQLPWGEGTPIPEIPAPTLTAGEQRTIARLKEMGAPQQFIFNLQGAFIADKETFVKEVTDGIDRASTLKYAGE